MAKMPLGQPRSVPDPAGDQYDAMLRRERLRQNAGAAQPIDPARTEVFRRGPDGKLHPVEGWHTTGPLEFGKWAHNINWGGVLRDGLDTTAKVAGSLIAGPIGGWEKAAILANLYLAGRDTQDDLQELDDKTRR